MANSNQPVFPIGKQFGILLLATLITIGGCSKSPSEAEITIEVDGEPTRTIRISIEGKEDVIIEDPFIEEIEALSKAYRKRRTQFAKEHKDMTLAEVDAYSNYADSTAERVRDLQKQRKAYIFAQVKEHNGTSYTTEGEGFNEAIEETNDYFKGLKSSN